MRAPIPSGAQPAAARKSSSFPPLLRLVFGVVAFDAAVVHAGDTDTIPPSGRVAAAYVSASFTPNPAPLGVPVRFDWQAVGAVRNCVLLGVPGHEGPVDTVGSVQVMAARSIAAVVRCDALDAGDAPVSTQVVLSTVDANVLPEVFASFSPDAIGRGQSSTFRWGSRYATQCWSDSGLVEVHGTQGSRGVLPYGNDAVTVTCSGPGGTASRTAYIWVREHAPVVHLRLLRDASYPSGWVDVYWDGEYATTCNGGPPQGRMLYHAVQSEWLPITCTGPGGKETGYVWIDAGALGRKHKSSLPDLHAVGLDASRPGLTYASADVDADGRSDLLVVDAATHTAYVLRGHKDGYTTVDATVADVDSLADIAGVEVTPEGAIVIRKR